MASMIGHRLVIVPLRQKEERRLALSGPPAGPWHPAVAAIVLVSAAA
ncbi:hypothetical protein [Amycolatopsis sp. cmx-8-4]